MDNRYQYILKWVTENRPDLDSHMHILPAFDNAGIALLLQISFEAGRTFQNEHPGAINGPIDYMDEKFSPTALKGTKKLANNRKK